MNAGRKRIRLIAAVAIVLAAAVAVGISVYAEFTKSYRAKRVIAAVAPEGMLFSSNYLESGSEIHFSTLRVGAGDASEYYDLEVTVSNHARGNNSRFYNRDIEYRLDTDIVTVSKNQQGETVITSVSSDRPAVKIDGAAMAAAYLSTIATGSARSDSYVLSLPRTMLTDERKMYVQLTATPVGSGYTDLQPISALFDLAVRAETVTVTWHIEPTDDRSAPAGDYSGFNYRLSGSGAGTVTLGWDASVLEISQVFKNEVGAASAALPDGWDGLTAVSFDVDAADINSYDIQFYMASSGSVNSWEDVNVQMVFRESTAPTP